MENDNLNINNEIDNTNDNNVDVTENDEAQNQDATEQNFEIVNEQFEEDVQSDDISGDESDPIPTVLFNSVTAPQKEGSFSGVKVFFALVGIAVALVIAVSAGFVFGKKSYRYVYDFNSSTPVYNKSESAYENDKSKIYNSLAESVVSIIVYNEEEGSLGYASGVIYSSDGYIVTNDHIYANVSTPRFLVTTNSGTEYDATFVAGDTRSDLAVLKINATGLTAARFGNSDEVLIGETALAIGYPSGYPEKAILTVGAISYDKIRISTSASSYTMKMIQTDTAINPGNSGGALVNMHSQVVGITSVKLAGTAYDSVGYAIPSNTVVKTVDSLIKNGFVDFRGKLGISYTFIDSISSSLNKIPVGFCVESISEDSDLYGKNISAKDIITHVNDVRIISQDVALDIIESTPPNVPISFTVYHIKTGESETFYASLMPDEGTSSYFSGVIDLPLNNSFPNNNSNDFYSDH